MARQSSMQKNRSEKTAAALARSGSGKAKARRGALMQQHGDSVNISSGMAAINATRRHQAAHINISGRSAWRSSMYVSAYHVLW